MDILSTEMFRDLTDINIKQMLYDQKIAEIENDIPSFGFIDDGSDRCITIEREETIILGLSNMSEISKIL